MKDLSVNDCVRPHRKGGAADPGNRDRMKSRATLWERLQVRHVLADWDAGLEEPGMGRSRRITDVVDIERVDANESDSLRDEKFGCRRCQERVVDEIGVGAPTRREIG